MLTGAAADAAIMRHRLTEREDLSRTARQHSDGAQGLLEDGALERSRASCHRRVFGWCIRSTPNDIPGDRLAAAQPRADRESDDGQHRAHDSQPENGTDPIDLGVGVDLRRSTHVQLGQVHDSYEDAREWNNPAWRAHALQ